MRIPERREKMGGNTQETKFCGSEGYTSPPHSTTNTDTCKACPDILEREGQNQEWHGTSQQHYQKSEYMGILP